MLLRDLVVIVSLYFTRRPFGLLGLKTNWLGVAAPVASCDTGSLTAQGE
jgi:hypothetical protein